VRPRRLVHQGVVEASGLVLEPSLVGERRARERLLARWTPGAVVQRSGARLILRLASPLRLACDAAPGTPLVACGKILIAAPMTEGEARAAGAADGDVVLVEGGEARPLPGSSCKHDDPAAWLDVSSFLPVEVRSLGPAAAPPPMALPAARSDARAVLGKIPPASPEAAVAARAIERALRKAKPRLALPASGKPGEEGAAGSAPEAARAARAGREARVAGTEATLSRALAGMLATLAMLLSAVDRALSGRPGLAGPGAGGAAGSEGEARGGRAPGKGQLASRKGLVVFPQGTPAGPRLLGRLASRLNDAVARFLMATRMADAIGRRQSEYVGRMIDMFERGDLDAALRHAIPLGGESRGETRPSLSVPSPRDGLQIAPVLPSGSTSLGFDGGVYEELKKIYQAAFERLEREGRVEEAAFVLAELLRESERAVAFLERHGKLALAAEIAEARGLPPGLVVRQWFLAGERGRALSVARRSGAFADAVARLEKSDMEQARALRLLWADTLASAGDYAAAVEVVWPLEGARRLALAWLDRSIAIGGGAGAKALVRKATLDGVAFADVKGPALALLDDADAEGAQARAAFGAALVAEQPTPALRALALAAARALMRDLALLPGGLSPAQIEQLVSLGDPGGLRSDLPALVALPRPSPTPPLTHRVVAADAGPRRAHDAAVLPDGKIAVALGEIGVCLLSRQGKPICTLDQPAERLVVSRSGDRAIGLSRRGDVWRLCRVDLAARRAEAWCEAAIEAFSPDFDGEKWFVASHGSVFAIDALSPRFEALWSAPSIGASIAAISCAGASLCIVVEQADGALEVWLLDLPSLTLRKREQVSPPRMRPATDPLARPAALPGKPAAAQAVAASAGGRVAVASAVADAASVRVVLLHERNAVEAALCPLLAGASPLAPVLDERHMIVLAGAPEARVLALRVADRSVAATVHLEGAAIVSARLAGESLCVCDDRGRLLVIDLAHGRVLRDLRV
jgi:hypothetical protein